MAQPGENQGVVWGARSNLEGRWQHLSALHTCSPALSGAEPRLIHSLPQGASGVGFCLASTSEEPTGCCRGALSSQVQWQLRVGLWVVQEVAQHWEKQHLGTGQASLAQSR